MLKINNDDFSNSDQILVRVWKACNFKCNFCNVSDNEKNVKQKESFKDIVRNFLYKYKHSNFFDNFITIVISWWEPSLFQTETLFAIRYIKNFFEKKNVKSLFEIQTNASNIDDNFAKKLKNSWIFSALVSFHTSEKITFEKIIGVSYDNNFYKIIKGVHNLNNNWIKVSFNIVMSNENIYTYIKTIKYLLKEFTYVDDYNLWVIQPHGEVLKNKHIIPIYVNLEKQYNKAIYILQKHWKKITSHFVWLPLCYTLKQSVVLELITNKLARKNYRFENKNLINNINDNNKFQTKDCDDCIYNNVCSWIWKEYVHIQKLKPIKYLKKFEIIKNSAYEKYVIINYVNIDILNYKKEYDWFKRIVFINSELLNIENINVLSKKLLSLWYYKISIYWNREFDLNLLFMWITNIQIDIWNINKDSIQKIIEFSYKNSPQFRIDLDIFINTPEDIQKILFIKDYLKINYIKIFIIKHNNFKSVLYINKINENWLDKYKWNIFTVWFYKKLIYNCV